MKDDVREFWDAASCGDEIYAHHLESPGTKAYTAHEARALLLRDFRDVRIQVRLSHGDLLESAAGQRHRGLHLDTARALWPRAVLRRVASGLGLVMMIEATK